jgi:hypothetical protein
MEKYTAVIIEPRIHCAWKLVLKNFLTNLDERWDFLIVCGLLNKDFLVDLIETNFKEHKHRITIHQLNIENFVGGEYTKFMIEPFIYELIPTETFITFQLDTLISAKYKDYIYDFLEYDYVGAPWRPGVLVYDYEKMDVLVGNGGLSLRKKTAMLNIIKNDVTNTRYENNINEDIFFSKNIKNKPSVETAKLFSVETFFSEKSFGIHNCHKWITREQIYKISEHTPDFIDLIYLLESK